MAEEQKPPAAPATPAAGAAATPAAERKGKKKTVAVTAVARELAGFIWAIHRQSATDRLSPV